MKIKLPTKKGIPNTDPEIEFEQLVIVGANGAGKTRFGSQIEQMHMGQTHRVSAQKSLSLPSEASPKSKIAAEHEFLYGYYHEAYSEQQQISTKVGSRWGGKLNTFLLNDYQQLMVLLHTEQYEEALKYTEGQLTEKPVTKLDTVQKIWETVFPHRKLLKKAGVIETYPSNDDTARYNASEMSDGERVVFYLIGEVVCAPKNSIIILDEPEMHLHKSLVKNLFDLIEAERSDCAFVYLTHDIDFAFTRQSAVKIWAKSYEGKDVWDYEVLNEESPIPEELYLEVLGSRKSIIFLEGNSGSIDYKLYEQVYQDYTVKPLGSCEKVIQTVKSFNEQKEFHHLESFGIIDRDRRPDSEVLKLNSNNIWVLDVAEVENLLLEESIVKAVAGYMGKVPDDVFSQVKNNVIEFFKAQLENQILIHYTEVLRKRFLELSNFTTKDIASVISEVDGLYASVNKQILYDETKTEMTTVLDSRDYEAVLRLFNLKNALIPRSKVCDLTDIKNKEGYFKMVITLLKRNDETSKAMRQAIKGKVKKTIS
jgi:ABC-type branched-subunit amino acid transport system ATPase component